MKATIKSIIVLLLFITLYTPEHLFSQNPIQEIEYQWNTNSDPTTFLGNESLIKTLGLPDDNTGGLPIEVIYSDAVNKYYVYTARYIIVIDGTTHNIIKRIEISERGTFDYRGASSSINRYHEKKMAYNPTLQCIYCATEDEDLKIINCNTNEVDLTFTQNEVIENFIINVYYNSASNKLFWLVSGYNNKAVLKTIDGTNNTLIDEREFQSTTFYKISGDESGNRLFLSAEKYDPVLSRSIEVLVASTLDDITSLNISYKAINLLHNPNTDKLYISPYQASFIGVINCDPNIYSYLYDITLPQYVKQLSYNPGNNRIYSCGGGYYGKFNIVDGINDQLITSISINEPNALIFNSTLNSIFCGGYNKIIKIMGNSNTITSQCSNNYGGISSFLAINETAGKIASANTAAGHVTFFDLNQPDPNIVLENYKQTGGSTYYGCYNTINKKYYFIQNDSENTKSFVNIYDGTNNQLINTLVIEGASELKTCTYNEMYNKVFISSEGSNKVYVISGQDDLQLSATISNVLHPRKIYSIPQSGKIVCGGAYKIYIINAENNQVIANINNPDEILISDFVISDLYSSKLYASCFYTGKILKIDLINNTIENTLYATSGQSDFAYDNTNHILYSVELGMTNSSVTVIDESTFTISTTINVKPFSSELEYNPLTKRVYLLSSGGSVNIGGITVIKGSNILKVIDIEGVHSNGMILNPLNNMFYFHTFYNPFSTDKESYVSAFDCTSDNIVSTIYLGQKQNFGEGATWFSVDEGMVLNPDKNQLIIGNRGFSNLSVIQCTSDILGLNYGWRWISFPRMERYAFADDPFHPVPIMKNTTLYDDDLYFTLWAQPEPTYEPYKRFNPNMPDPWSGLLYEANSTKGYKYEVSPSDLPQPKQILKGARLYPECPVELPAPGEEKWIGYFIEESQDPWDAFPSEIYNGEEGLTMIQAQYWTMTKLSWGGGSVWIKSGKVTPIKYGDMVIIKYQGSDPNFVWNGPDNSEEDREIPKPQAYTWEEKADYIPFYVETDPTSDIEEIAVLADGECIGATVRQPGDSLVEVDGYLGELPVGAEVEFETWNGYKSSPVERNGYVVYNPFTHKKEKRNIYVGENQDYYMVSLKADEVFELPDDVSHISCQPNPFSNEMTLSIRMNSAQHVAVEVYNIQGSKVKTLLNSNLPDGYYEVVWRGDNETGNKVKEGVYFYKIKTGNGTEVTDKIVLLK